MALVQLRQRREIGSGGPKSVASLSVLILLTLLLATPHSLAAAQSVGWAVAPSVIIDTEFGEDTQVGPGIMGEIEVKADNDLSYSATIFLARTDFPVGANNLHRNFGSVAFGARLMRDGERPSVGLLFGIGALFWDDVSETDPAMRSSANAEEMILPGVELRWPLGGGLGISLSVRDQLTGWWNAILDSSEGELNHRFVIGAGIYRW